MFKRLLVRTAVPRRVRSPQTLAYVLVALVLLGGSAFVVVSTRDPGPLYIGVMLPVSGRDDVGWRQPLDWAIEAVNAGGGINGRKVAFKYVDIAVVNPEDAAHELADDKSVLAVIGPDKSSLLFDLAPIFINAKKPLISSSSTSGDITRAFAGSGYVWRTVESDIGQLQAMLLIASERNVTNIALLTQFDTYGSTFFDWFGFFATELGMNVTQVLRVDAADDCAEPVSEVLASQPELVIVVPSQRSTALCIAHEMREHSDVPMLFSDGGMFPALIAELGPEAEGLTGMTLAPDPTSGFTEAYHARFGANPPAYAANSYDAVLLLAYALERSSGKGGPALADAIAQVTNGEGDRTKWDAEGVASTLRAIKDGKTPAIGGATGELDFGTEKRIDLVWSYFAQWTVQDGAFVFTDYISTNPEAHEGSSAAEAVFRDLASSQRQAQVTFSGTGPPRLQRTGLWALIVATSGGWDNYRHQADAMAQYQLLRQNGVPDDRIILILADDLARAPENTRPGTVIHAQDGPNLYDGIEIDYDLDDLNAADILAILAGNRSNRLPKVIESSASDNVYVYVSGHGNSQGLFVGVDTASERVGAASFISPTALSSTIAQMDTAGHYRQILLALEACHAGVMARSLDAPGALVITGANAFENSLATRYAPDLDAWLGDEFSVAITDIATRTPNTPLAQLYRQAYLEVPGSHVSVYNAANFGNLDSVSLREFIAP